MRNLLEKLGLTDYYGPTLLGLIFIVALLFGSIMTSVFSLGYVKCRQYQDLTGRVTQYAIPAGCFVRYGDTFIPVEEFKARAVTNERAQEQQP